MCNAHESLHMRKPSRTYLVHEIRCRITHTTPNSSPSGIDSPNTGPPTAAPPDRLTAYAHRQLSSQRALPPLNATLIEPVQIRHIQSTVVHPRLDIGAFLCGRQPEPLIVGGIE